MPSAFTLDLGDPGLFGAQGHGFAQGQVAVAALLADALGLVGLAPVDGVGENGGGHRGKMATEVMMVRFMAVILVLEAVCFVCACTMRLAL